MSAKYKRPLLTEKGIALLAKAHKGDYGIRLTRAATGDGEYTDEDDLRLLESLKHERQSFGFNTIDVQNKTHVFVKFVITNHKLDDDGLIAEDLEEGYNIKEIGIFAEDPDEGEILYAITIAEEGRWDYLESYDGLVPQHEIVEVLIEVSNAENVEINYSDGTWALAEDLEALKQFLLEKIAEASSVEQITYITNQITFIENKIGHDVLTTEEKDSIIGAINELKLRIDALDRNYLTLYAWVQAISEIVNAGGGIATDDLTVTFNDDDHAIIVKGNGLDVDFLDDDKAVVINRAGSLEFEYNDDDHSVIISGGTPVSPAPEPDDDSGQYDVDDADVDDLVDDLFPDNQNGGGSDSDPE